MQVQSAAPAQSGPSPRRPRVYVVIVNFGPVGDTLECLESVQRLRYPELRIVLCDNGSTAESLGLLRGWAAGSVAATAAGPVGRRLAASPAPKPLTHTVLAPGAAAPVPVPLAILPSPENRGFAGGNNLGLRYALADREAAYFWLLNNDTAVEPDALDALVARMEAEPGLGLCGSTLLYYAEPDRVQARGGGRYDRWLGRTRLAGLGKRHSPEACPREPLDYVHGASMLVRRSFLESVGLLDESYFLYFEELDWAARARGRFGLGYAPDSIVYHKEGASAGSATLQPARRSALSDYHGIRSRLIYTRRHHPVALPTVLLGLAGVLVNRARRRQWARIPPILRLMREAGRV